MIYGKSDTGNLAIARGEYSTSSAQVWDACEVDGDRYHIVSQELSEEEWDRIDDLEESVTA